MEKSRASRLPDTTVDTFPEAFYDEAVENLWTEISMKNDWKRIFSFDLSQSCFR